MMPIVRTFGCESCGYVMDLTLTMDQADDPPPDCPRCAEATTQQYKPFAITGSVTARAHTIAEEIVTSDYHAADFQREHRQEGTPAVRYNDAAKDIPTSTWSNTFSNPALERAIVMGRQTRLRYGSGLDVLKANLASGAEPDLIANSKRRSMKVW